MLPAAQPNDLCSMDPDGLVLAFSMLVVSLATARYGFSHIKASVPNLRLVVPRDCSMMSDGSVPCDLAALA
jgi:hypothetical protein